MMYNKRFMIMNKYVTKRKNPISFRTSFKFLLIHDCKIKYDHFS